MQAGKHVWHTFHFYSSAAKHWVMFSAIVFPAEEFPFLLRTDWGNNSLMLVFSVVQLTFTIVEVKHH